MNRQQELLKDPLFMLLVDENISQFNAEKRKKNVALDFSGAMLRGLDLRNMDATNINFTNAYFRGADLRGIDFSTCQLGGASIAGSKISGAYFPKNLAPDEIRLSYDLGTRMRTVDD